MNQFKWAYWILGAILSLVVAMGAEAAYDHGGADTDSAKFLEIHPDKAGTKLDSCALCHSGGTYVNSKGRSVTLGSCQWCHYAFGYDASGDITETLNAYGKDYQGNGGSAASISAIEHLDSDGDGFSNAEEITALRFPGNAGDDPSKVTAPFRVYTLEELEALPEHSQFMLMNTTKSGDFYARYSGVAMADLLDHAGMLPSATAIRVYAPDGFSQDHPLETDPLLYHVIGPYPPATFYYDEEADTLLNLDYGWCDYSSPYADGREHGDPIENENGLQLLLAYLRDGRYLEPGVLTDDNKLDGEGPFRMVTPQKVPSPPDQSSRYDGSVVPIWPYDEAADHNAGSATRSATMIRIDPLPDGTTDIDTLEAGWEYVDEGKIIVYGALDPLPTIETKLANLYASIRSENSANFNHRICKWLMALKIKRLQKMIRKGAYTGALCNLEKSLLSKTDGCLNQGSPDRNDWITDCALQKATYWSLHEIIVLLKIVA
ncbi:MAG: hypothetical protein P8X96_02135 [Desulfobacteraceae bacterium]